MSDSKGIERINLFADCTVQARISRVESCHSLAFAFGLEPSNSSVQGRGWHEQRGDLHTLAPQGTERKSLTFTVIEGAEAIDALIARRDTLLG